MKSFRSATSSPLRLFESVKLELAILLGLVIAVALVVWRIDAPHWFELLVLAVTGAGAGGWLTWRTHRVAVISHDEPN